MGAVFLSVFASMQRVYSSFLRGSRFQRVGFPVSTVRSSSTQTYQGVGGDAVERPNFSALNLSESTEDKKNFSYFICGLSGLTFAVGAGELGKNIALSMNPAKDVLAMANIEVDLSQIAEGDHMTLKWRGIPLFVRHRTQEEIDSAIKDDETPMRDEQADSDRVLNPKYLVVLGVCTHLGCVPIANAGDYGGYFCPCHGSHYDTSGRIRRGPAPLNSEVPPYHFISDDVILVGGD